MNIPKVVFEKYTLEENIAMIKDFYFNSLTDEDTFNPKDYVIEQYPLLSTISNKTKEEQEKIVEEEVTKLYKKLEERIEQRVTHFQEVWDKVGNDYLRELSNYLNIKWPIMLKEISAKVGYVPICPRYLDDYSFVISAMADDFHVREITAHELCHFLWFEKIKEMYPEISREEYDSPYIPWKYSEMVVDPILNSKELNRYLGIEEKAYDEFYELIDNDNQKKVMDNLNEIYQKNIPIEEKVKKGYQYVENIYKSKGREK